MSSRRWRDGARGRTNSVHDKLQNNMQPSQSEGNNERLPWPSSLGLTREARTVYVVNGVLDEVLQEVPRPTASISQEKVPLRNQITWTKVHGWGLMDERGGEQVLDAEVQRETEAHILNKALLDGHCKPKQRTTQHSLELEVCQNEKKSGPRWVMSVFQPRLNA